MLEEGFPKQTYNSKRVNSPPECFVAHRTSGKRSLFVVFALNIELLLVTMSGGCTNLRPIDHLHPPLFPSSQLAGDCKVST